MTTTRATRATAKSRKRSDEEVQAPQKKARARGAKTAATAEDKGAKKKTEKDLDEVDEAVARKSEPIEDGTAEKGLEEETGKADDDQKEPRKRSRSKISSPEDNNDTNQLDSPKAKNPRASEVVEEVQSSDSDDEDDGCPVKFVMRDVNEIQALLKEGTHTEEDKEEEQVEAGNCEYSGMTTMKFSGQTAIPVDPALSAKLATISEEKYANFTAELEKHNTPFDMDMDSTADKPWTRNINSSLDDYFNFGFNENSWKEYATRQVALRVYRLETGKSALEDDEGA